MKPSRDAAIGDVLKFEEVFDAQFPRIVRAIDRVIRDGPRAEDLGVEAFWRLWNTPRAHGPAAGAWVHRTAVRLALDELRRRARRARYESMLAHFGAAPRPDELFSSAEEHGRVRAVLAVLTPRDAEMLLLQSDEYSYADLATVLGVKAASVGTLLSRARQAFRKEYVKRYGEP